MGFFDWVSDIGSGIKRVAGSVYNNYLAPIGRNLIDGGIGYVHHLANSASDFIGKAKGIYDKVGSIAAGISKIPIVGSIINHIPGVAEAQMYYNDIGSVLDTGKQISDTVGSVSGAINDVIDQSGIRNDIKQGNRILPVLPRNQAIVQAL